MKFNTIPCPFCKTGHAHITYEENRVYQLNCPDCGSAIFRKDKSWDAAVEFFEWMTISSGWIPVTERLREAIILKLCEMEANEKGVSAATIRDIRYMVENLEM